jgi:membrane-associated phospholipid phosphatase
VVIGSAIFDEEIRDKLLGWKNTDPSEDLRKLGDRGQVAGPVIGTVFALHGWLADNDKSKETAYLTYESFIWAGLIAGVMKAVVGRDRPNKTDDPAQFSVGARDSSFPSGHTTTAFAAATVFSEQYPEWYVYVPAYGAATAVGFSRMYANQHWFSDVVAGAMLGTSVSHVLRKRHRRSRDAAWDFQIDPAGMRLVRKF